MKLILLIFLFSITACATEERPAWKFQDPADIRTPATVPSPEIEPDYVEPIQKHKKKLKHKSKKNKQTASAVIVD